MSLAGFLVLAFLAGGVAQRVVAGPSPDAETYVVKFPPVAPNARSAWIGLHWDEHYVKGASSTSEFDRTHIFVMNMGRAVANVAVKFVVREGFELCSTTQAVSPGMVGDFTSACANDQNVAAAREGVIFISSTQPVLPHGYVEEAHTTFGTPFIESHDHILIDWYAEFGN